MLNSKKIFVVSAVAVIAATALVTLYFYPPSQYNFYPKCLLYQYTGIYCPGCGGTRATYHLLHGRFLEALRMNALTVLLLPALFVTLVWQTIFKKSEKPFLHLITGPKTAWAIAILVIGFGLIRNIPIAPFSWLAPQNQTGSQTKQ